MANTPDEPAKTKDALLFKPRRQNSFHSFKFTLWNRVACASSGDGDDDPMAASSGEHMAYIL